MRLSKKMTETTIGLDPTSSTASPYVQEEAKERGHSPLPSRVGPRHHQVRLCGVASSASSHVHFAGDWVQACSALSPAICLLGMISPPGCRTMGFVVPLHISGLHSLSWLLLEVSQPCRCCGKQAQGSPTPQLKQMCFSFWKETFLFR